MMFVGHREHLVETGVDVEETEAADVVAKPRLAGESLDEESILAGLLPGPVTMVSGLVKRFGPPPLMPVAFMVMRDGNRRMGVASGGQLPNRWATAVRCPRYKEGRKSAGNCRLSCQPPTNASRILFMLVPNFLPRPNGSS